jgi:hypothetical protein
MAAAALAGTGFPIDRAYTAELLGFDAPAENSLDAVSDRDFAIEYCSAAAMLMTHLSRFSEELILWSSAQFDFIELSDSYCTGSSIMPQKKNPDVPELVRGKTGRVNGNLVALLTLMKGQPLAYNKDNQEDKEPLFDTVDTVLACLGVYTGMLPQMRLKPQRMLDAARKGYATATDLADYPIPRRPRGGGQGRAPRHRRRRGSERASARDAAGVFTRDRRRRIRRPQPGGLGRLAQSVRRHRPGAGARSHRPRPRASRQRRTLTSQPRA